MTTEAGKRLLSVISEADIRWPDDLTRLSPQFIAVQFAAIEAEAVAAERSRVVREAEWLQVQSPSDADKPGWYWDGWHAAIALIVALWLLLAAQTVGAL